MAVLNEVLASTAAGGTATILGHPLDCIKVRLQAAQRADLGTFHCARLMLHGEGPSVFFRGLGPPLANSVMMNTVMFVAFAEARLQLPGGILGSLLAGAFSGAVTAYLSTPFDIVKIQAQLRSNESGMLLFRRLLHSDPRLLYTGHTANLLREGVFTAVYLGFYDALRELMACSSPSERAPLMLVAATSAITGALAWVVSYPFDVIKSMQQSQPLNTPASARHSMASAVRALYRFGGCAAFFRGVSASTVRAVLVSCSRLVTYEAVKQRLPRDSQKSAWG